MSGYYSHKDLTFSTHFLATFWIVHCSRRMHESLASGGAMSVVADLSWPWGQLANSSTSMHIGTRLRHNVCICFCTRAVLSHWHTNTQPQWKSYLTLWTAASLTQSAASTAKI